MFEEAASGTIKRSLRTVSNHLLSSQDETDAKVASWLVKRFEVEEQDVYTAFYAKASYSTVSVETKIPYYKASEKLLRMFYITKTFTWSKEDMRKRMRDKANMAAQILRDDKGVEVDRIQVLYVFKDWTKRRRIKYVEEGGAEYPNAMELVEEKVYKPKLLKKAMEKKAERFALARAGKEVYCTSEEMWERESELAVHISGKRKAYKLFPDTKEGAERARNMQKDLIARHDKEVSVLRRPGERVRCEKYCEHRNHCVQFKNYLNAIEEDGKA